MAGGNKNALFERAFFNSPTKEKRPFEIQRAF
jgi:hypothetical protein